MMNKEVNFGRVEHMSFQMAKEIFRYNFSDAKIVAINLRSYDSQPFTEDMQHIVSLIDIKFETQEWQRLKGEACNVVQIQVRMRALKDFWTWVPYEVVRIRSRDEFTNISVPELVVEINDDALKQWNPKWKLVPACPETE